MTITLLAPDGVAVTAKQERQANAGVYGGSPSRPLGGRSGFRPGTPSDTLTATSTTWTLKPCAAMIDPGATTHQGMYGWSTDANVTGAVTAADATNGRIDVVYVQVNDSTSGDASGEVTYGVKYLAGTPATTPAAPILPPRSFLLGTISVPKAGSGSPTVALNTARFAAAGGIVQVWSTAERDGLDKFDGLTVQRMDLAGRGLEAWDGANWNSNGAPVTYAPLSPSGWTCTGDITVTPEGTRRRVVADITVKRSGGDFTLPSDTWSTLGSNGVILPAAAMGSSPVKYLSCAVVGGGNNASANVAYNPNSGTSVRAVGTAYTFTNGALFTVNLVYYI